MFTKAQGIIINTKKYGEGDLLVTAICRELGTITVMCRGGASSRCKFSFCLQPMCYDELVLYNTKNGGYILKEAAIERQFFEVTEDSTSYDIGCYLCELASYLCVGENDDDDDEVLRLLLNSLHLLGTGSYDALHIKAVFELRAMSLSGYTPLVDVCTRCGKNAFESENKNAVRSAYFDLLEGGVVCAECRDEANKTQERRYTEMLISSSVNTAVKFVISALPDKVFGFSLTEFERETFYSLCEKYVKNQLDVEFTTLKQYYRKLEYIKKADSAARRFIATHDTES